MQRIRTKFSFEYNLNHDLENYVNSVLSWKRTDHGVEKMQENISSQLPEDLKQSLDGAPSQKAKTEIVKEYLTKREERDGDIYEITIKALSEAWALRQNKIVERLEKLYEKPFDFEKIDINLTTLPIRPYDFKERYLMVSFFQSLPSQLKTIVHELFHFMLHAHYDRYLKDKVESFEHYEMVKEALTVFINSDFLDLVIVPDTGYPKEQTIRQELLVMGHSKYPFQEILDKLVAKTRVAC